ncbi:MAG: hypothetical protein Q8L48_17630 [Archangium sp.]|nr:hypothetical protein [Archangium sp.]
MRSPLPALLLALSLTCLSAWADSVAQVSTAKRISRQTVVQLDPQGGRTVVDGGVTDTTIRPGDVLTFIIQFTPVPNGAVRGLGGYVTEYVPRNTQVVGARIVDRNGRTVPPHRGGLAPDGFGPRGSVTWPGPLVDGSLSQLYADTGIFYSTDPRTQRTPNNTFLSLTSGLPMTPRPTGANGLAQILGLPTGSTLYAHNLWDLTQVMAFGVNAGGVNPNGQGTAPEAPSNPGVGYGSAVAGPDSWYRLEASHDPALGPAVSNTTVRALGTTGPWKRLRTTGGEIGARGAVPPMAHGSPTRVGTLAVSGSNLLGWDLTPDNPLPSYDPANPGAPWTNALRFALGELVVGDEYYAEVSLRVLATPLDPLMMMDANCAEVTGGDASAMDQVSGGGKDNTWRYFLPAPSCVVMNNFFENRVDKLIALPGDTLTYTIEGKNLSTNTQTNVRVIDCFNAGQVTFVSASGGGTVDPSGAGCPNPATEDAVVWSPGTLAPGAGFTFTVTVTGGNATSTLNQAVYTSTALPSPGFTAVAFTNLRALTLVRLALVASPDTVLTPPGMVHYTATIGNAGTGLAGVTGCSGQGCYLRAVLPAGFSYVASSARLGGAAVANPAVAGPELTFTSGLVALPANGAPMVLEFDASVAAGTTPGVYSAGLSSWLRDVGFGKDVEDSLARVAPVVVGQLRSATPTVNAPLTEGARTVGGATTEAAGSVVRLFVNGNPAGTGPAAAGGTFSLTVATLFAGQEVRATVQATGKAESLLSAPVIVQALGGVASCGDGLDNDADGLVDFPADPGCTSTGDIDETDVPQCSDGLDNDGDGLVDFPADPGCSSFVDNTEGGMAACGDGVDNDSDSRVDFPADPGCTSATDTSELDLPACADGLDNDGDGKTDYPDDPGCSFAVDPDENDAVAQPDGGVDAGVADAGLADAGGAGGGTGGGTGGAGADAGADGADGGMGGVAVKGCGCGTGAGPELLGALSLLAAWRRRRFS